MGDTMKKGVFLIQGIMIILSIFFLCQQSLAGVAIEQVVRDMEERASVVFLYFSESQFRTDHPEAGMSTIIDFKNDRMVMVDHRGKSYVETKFSQWEKEIAKRFKEESSGMKPKSRKIVVRKTGESTVINGFRTDKVQLLADGELIEENWVTRDVNMEEIAKVMDKIAQGFPKELQSEMKEGQEIYQKMKPYGFPILVKDYALTHGLKAIDVLEVKKLEKKELKDELFSPPKGYERIVPQPPMR